MIDRRQFHANRQGAAGTGGSPGRFLRLTDVEFRSDSRHEARFAAGRFCCFEDVAANCVVILITPAAPAARPLRMMLEFDAALEAAHQLIAAAARLHRGRQQP